MTAMKRDYADSIRHLAENYTVAWCSHDSSRVAACYEENGSLKVNDDAPAVGREAIAAVAQGFMVDFPDMQVLLEDLVMREDGVEYHWRLTGTNDGPGGTGRSVNITGYEEWQISVSGLIARSEGHFDSLEYRRQLGL
jgi:ketosteroid isomerase-like protein